MPKAIRQDVSVGNKMHLVILPPINMKTVNRFFEAPQTLRLNLTEVIGSPRYGIAVTGFIDECRKHDFITMLETTPGVKVTRSQPFSGVNCSTLEEKHLTRLGAKERPDTTIFVKLEEN
ncbi:MAG: hypothetical protein Q7R50_02415 [Dehalococcoidales bacterium]|nr:hypothetical protein [Dehalococcoidales bacterium]